MIFSLVLLAMSVAEIGMIWRALVTDNASLKSGLEKILPHLAFEAVTCSFCLTFWLSLAAAILFDPLRGFLPPLRLEFISAARLPLQIVFTWMVLGTATLAVRTLAEQLFRITAVLACIVKNHPLHKH